MNGENIVKVVSELLKKEGKLLTDTNIVNKLRELSYTQVSNLLNGTLL